MALKARKAELFSSVMDDGNAFGASLDADDIRGAVRLAAPGGTGAAAGGTAARGRRAAAAVASPGGRPAGGR